MHKHLKHSAIHSAFDLLLLLKNVPQDALVEFPLACWQDFVFGDDEDSRFRVLKELVVLWNFTEKKAAEDYQNIFFFFTGTTGGKKRQLLEILDRWFMQQKIIWTKVTFRKSNDSRVCLVGLSKRIPKHCMTLTAPGLLFVTRRPEAPLQEAGEISIRSNHTQHQNSQVAWSCQGTVAARRKSDRCVVEETW